MILPWLKRRRRKRILAGPFPAGWEEIIHHNVRMYELLAAPERERLRRDVRVFVAEKNWEGIYGLEMNDEVRVTVAAQACLMVLGLNVSWFDRVVSILVYPDAYSVPEKRPLEGGGVIEGESDRLGEHWYRGAIILSWPDVLSGGRREARGRNLVIHEFAHEIDSLNGRAVDGTPPLPDAAMVSRWETVMAREYERLVRACRAGQPTLLDCYGTESRGEFFAVASEIFFQDSVRMLRRHPEMYELMCAAYRQDPAARVLRRGGDA